MINKRLAHYVIVRQLGKGGMGEVFLADDTKLNRKVALKILPDEMAADPERRARFQREAQAVAALSHPNIVTVHSVEEVDGIHFITMEFIEGQTLTEILPKDGFSLRRLLELAIPLADAISCAHRAGITHRDLKPDNLMVDADGRLRVLDFGLAKRHDAMAFGDNTQAKTATADTDEGKILGTVAYMSPEQAEGKPVDSRSDIFSLGTMLFEMASGVPPFRGDTSMSTIGAILKEDPASITDLNPALPRHLGRIVKRCLAKSVERRYQTALDLRNELDELKAEIDSGEHGGESTTSAGSSTRRRPILIAVSAVAGLALALTIAITSREAAPPPTVYTPRPITASSGWKGDINWSPESEFIAYSHVRSGSLAIVAKPVAGGDPVVRVNTIGDDVAPRFSPDGKYLAYISSSEPGSYVFLMPPYGGPSRKLIDTGIPALELDLLNQSMGDRPWSVDGGNLLVSRFSPPGQVAIYRVGRENGDAVQLTEPPIGSDDLGASYSMDGQIVVFQRRTHGRGALWTMSPNGEDPQPLLADEFDNLSPTWRADGRRLVFRSDRGGSGMNVWEIDVATGALKQLTIGTLYVYFVTVSADDRIAYTPFSHDTFLFTVDLETGEKTQLTSHSADNFGARFSPDGTSVTYHSTRTGDSEIWLHHLDGRPETRITNHPSWDLYPEFSPDGKKLVFVSNREGPFKPFVANSDGGDVRRLVDQSIVMRTAFPVNTELVCRWSPAGDRIAYLIAGDEGTALWTVRPDGSDARKLLDGVKGFDWYRDGRHAIYTRRLGSENQLVAINLETTRERILFTGPIMEIDVAPDGRSVAFCYGRAHMGMGLARLRLELPTASDDLPRVIGEPEYVVATEASWHVHDGGWSPDSKTMVYTRDLDFGNLFELVERR